LKNNAIQYSDYRSKKRVNLIALAITRRGKPVLAVMTWEHYEAILETIEILGDANLMANLHQGITEAKSAQGIDWESAKRELDL